MIAYAFAVGLGILSLLALSRPINDLDLGMSPTSMLTVMLVNRTSTAHNAVISVLCYGILTGLSRVIV